MAHHINSVGITSKLFFQISAIFPTCFRCFLPANTTNKKSLKNRNLRDQDRDSQKWVSRQVLRPRQDSRLKNKTCNSGAETKLLKRERLGSSFSKWMSRSRSSLMIPPLAKKTTLTFYLMFTISKKQLL